MIKKASLLCLLLASACTTSTSPNRCTTNVDCSFVQLCEANVCVDGPLAKALPPLGDETGPGGASASVIQDTAKLLTGDAAQGRVGDMVIENNRGRFIIQKPGRDFSVVPYGGHVIDAVAIENGEPGEDHFGEIMPLLNLGMTVDFRQLEIIRDGSRGGSAVVRAYGRPAVWDYVNLTGFLSDGFSTLTPFNPDEPLPLQVVATYELPPDSRVLRVSYTLWNMADVGRLMPVGVALDSGGVVHTFRAGAGFGSPPYTLEGILDGARPVPWFGYIGEGTNTAIRPWPIEGERSEDSNNPTAQVAGVTVSLFSRPDVLAAFADSDFFIRAGEARHFGFDLAVSGRSISDASAALLKVQGAETHDFTVTVLDASANEVPNASVVIRRVNGNGSLGDPIAMGTTDDAGIARFSTPRGRRVIQVYSRGSDVPADVELDETQPTFTVVVNRPGHLAYEFGAATSVDNGALEQAPCRITIAGAEQIPDEILRSSENDRPSGGIAELVYSGTCSSALDGRTIPIQPGRYLVAVSAGPLFDTWQGLVDVGIGGATVRGEIHRVVDGNGYLSTDWHQHSVNSPDSPVALRDRLLSYLGEGVELFGGSDHDSITDWEKLVVDMGFGDRIEAINGVESTTFDYGHFNIFPLIPDPNSVSGGALDWAGGDGLGLTPEQIFRAYRQRGARVVQVNHPRGGFQGYFDRAALTFDFDNGVALGDVGNQPASNEELRLDPLAQLWTSEFDAVEIYNGFSPYDGALPSRARGDKAADRILLDVGNLIAVGHRPVMTGTSDTHKLRDTENGYPRTYVRAGRELSGKADRWEVLGALAGLGNAPNRGDVIASNGPLPIITATTGARPPVTPGATLLATRSKIHINITVQTPPWMQLSGADVLVSPTYRDPPDENTPPTPTLEAMFGAPAVEQTGNGGTRHVYRTTIEVDPMTDNPFPGKDAAIIVRVFGNRALWPVLTNRVQLTIDENASTVEEFARVDNGVAAYAVANPIYVDIDGDGIFRGAYQR